MSKIVTRSVKDYVSTYFSDDILITNDRELGECRCVSVGIKGKREYSLVIRVSNESLAYMCNALFGFSSEEMYDDISKELANIIAGKMLAILDDGSILQIPKMCDECTKTDKGIFFKNKNIHLSILLMK